MTNDELLDRFAREYQAFHGISEARRGSQMRTLRKFANQIAPRGLLEGEGADLTEFMGRMLDGGSHPNTVRWYANHIRPFYSWAYAAGLYPVERFMGLKSARNPRGASGRSTPRPYTPAQVRQFFRELDDAFKLDARVNIDRRIRRWVGGHTKFGEELYRHGMKLQIEAVASLALHCGLRRGEISRLGVDDVHHDNLYVVVDGARKNPRGESVAREVPHTPPSREAIRNWLEFRTLMRPDHDHAWLSIRGGLNDRSRAMPDRTLFKLLHHVGAWELQRFRHTFATERLRAGMELEALSKMLGHSSLQQTLAYAEIVKADVYRATERTNDAFARRVGRRAA